jgi:psiF repeat-containing protein
MNTRVLSIIAGAVLALCVSTTAAADAAAGEAAKPAPDTDKPKAVAAREPAAEPATGAQQNKMKRCNEEAKKKELKGDERRAFMSTCLKA